MDSNIKIKRLINAGFASSACNLNCSYCYITQIPGMRNNRIPRFQYTQSQIKAALTKDRLGGTCIFNLCANGETLLPKEIPGILRGILENGHYVELVTNATITKRFDEILEFPSELLAQISFKFSFHYLELLRNNLLDTFIYNVNRMRKAGSSFTIEVVPADELIPYIDEVKTICIDSFGALPHLTVARDHYNDLKMLTKLSKDEYAKTWASFNSEMFDFKMSTFGVKRNEYCYAGEWLLDVDIETGQTTQCYCTQFNQNIFSDISKPITFLPIGKHCSLEHCVNSHAMLTLGMIPEYDAITYAQVRNRVTSNGEEWLTPTMKIVMSNKFKNNNIQYNTKQKISKAVQRELIKNMGRLSRLPRKIEIALKKIKT